MTDTWILPLILLLSTLALSGTSTCLNRLGKLQGEEELKKNAPRFFFKHLLHFFFGMRKWEGFLFSLSLTKHLLRVGFVLSAFFFLLQLPYFKQALLDDFILGTIILIILFTSLTTDLVCSLFGQLKPYTALSVFLPIASLILCLCIPFTSPFFHIFKFTLPKGKGDLKPSFRMRNKIQEILQETELNAYLDAHEKKFILSVVSFKDRIAREVMVPRIQLFALPIDTLLEKAAETFVQEGYSRIPIYRDHIDDVAGVLHYKDLLNVYATGRQGSQKIESLLKPILYTPETKKISLLLQEFRSKQIHLAIVVDEWGGTEGIVTIEDVLEELVGEISDEYDVAHTKQYTALSSGGWVVDASMSIIDILEEINIEIPLSPEYDTIGGYIFHRAGTIPVKGWRIHHDDFDLEVLSSSERALEKIRITPH